VPDVDNPRLLRMKLHSLRYWNEVYDLDVKLHEPGVGS
jgi:hypothetical protein